MLRQEAFFEGQRDPRAPVAPATSPGSHPAGGQLTDRRLVRHRACRPSACTSTAAGIRHRDEHGRPVVDDSYLVQLHAGAGAGDVALPGPPWADGYELTLSTEYADRSPAEPVIVAPGPIEVPARCVWLLRVLRRP